MRNLEPRQRRWVRARIAILTGLLLVGALLIVKRAHELQLHRAPALRELAEEQYLRDVRLAPKRGTIYDRQGAELGVSVEVDSVWANPRALRKSGGRPELVAQQLASVLTVDPARTAQRLASDRFFVWIARRVTPQQAAAVRQLNLPGVSMSRESRRFYPNRELAAHVLGFANVDGVGIEGLELSYEEQLRGSVRAVPAIRDRTGAVVFSEQLLDDGAAQGNDIVLTIDKTIQNIAERELAMAANTFEARAGSVVVLDPRNGELLAIANYPTFNPNEAGEAPASHRRNRAVTDRFEPGSTIKPFTIAAALAAGTVRPRQWIDCEKGRMQVAEYTIHDSEAFEMLTPGQILAYSSNVGTAKIGATLGRRRLFRALRRFGFGEVTGLPLPGETAGILRHYKRWYDMDAATISFGQGMSVTAVQLAVAMGTLANGGRLMQPILVKRVVDSMGRTVEEATPFVRRQVVPGYVANMLSDMLTAVTGEDGTGYEASIDGYPVAGKTGTAQKADYVAGGYAEDRWLASFVGFVPSDAPRLVIAVVLDEPVIAHYGGAVAGPVFRRIGEAALRHLGVPPRGRTQSPLLAANDSTARPSSRRRAEPPREVVSVDPPGNLATDADGARIPDLLGRTARGALVTAMNAGFSVELEGSGVVVRQDPPAGRSASLGTRVHVVLAPNVEADEPVDTEEMNGTSTPGEEMAMAGSR